jgi:hypothetical protein
MTFEELYGETRQGKNNKVNAGRKCCAGAPFGCSRGSQSQPSNVGNSQGERFQISTRVENLTTKLDADARYISQCKR